MLNRCEFIGNLTKDPEMKQTPNGTEVTNFDIAINKKWTDSNGNQQEKVEFVSFVAFKKVAEIITTYAKKGDRIYLAWELQTRSWEAEDWTKRYKTEIFVEKVVLLWTPGGNENTKPAKQTPNNGYAPKPLPPKPRAEEEISIEDIPF